MEENKNPEEKNEPIEGTVVEKTVVEETAKDSTKAEVKEDLKAAKEKISKQTENIKNETKDTVNKVKETIKSTDFKKDANETTGFVKDMFFNPFEAVKRAADEENIIGKVIILMIVFIVANVIKTIIRLPSVGFFDFGINFIKLLLSIISPIITVIVPALVILVFNRENKKSLLTIISTVVVAKIPLIFNTILAIISSLISELSIITSPINATLTAVSTILLYFGYKELANKEEKGSTILTFALIILISEAILVLLSRIGIY